MARDFDTKEHKRMEYMRARGMEGPEWTIFRAGLEKTNKTEVKAGERR